MHETPTVTQLARQLMTEEMGAIQDSEGLASAVVAFHTKVLTGVSFLVGVLGSVTLFRRSVWLTQTAFPHYAEVLAAEPSGILHAVGALIEKQPLDIGRESSIALMTTNLEVRMIFIGEPLTRQLVLDAWPVLRAPLSQERQA